jgi:AcrR family transcriptional regulator
MKKKNSRQAGAVIERDVARRKNGDETRARIIDVAERLFAENGVDAVSLRQIMTVAGVNISLINYHFGTKEGLLRAIFARRIEPLNRQRLAMLEKAEMADDPPRLEDLLRAFFLPRLKVSLSTSKSSRPERLFGRIFSDSSPLTRRIIPEFFDEFQYRFINSLKRTLPDMPDKDIYWRLHFLLCVAIQTPLYYDRIRKLSGGLCNFRDPEELFAELLPILIAALRAPATSDQPTRSNPARTHRR